MIIDLHSHLLPGVDDGAKTLEKSLELARIGEKEGVEHLVLTPHHRNGVYVNHKKDVIAAADKLQAEYERHNLAMKVYPSQEIRLTEQFFEDFYANNLLSLDAEGRYYLIEFPTASVPSFTKGIFEELLQMDRIPVIAHPERNQVLQKDFRLMYELIEMGALAQITSSSYSGYYGEELQNISREMIKANLAHIIASDVHHLDFRPFNMEAAFEQLTADFGEETTTYFKENARHIFNGDDVPRRKPVEPGGKGKKKFNLFKFFK
ncbi:tyrosine-protein phosphatase [Fundicoccus culcitae]|uniref:Tyrosine-protein phosphatase n=1 Tax=Fundicoccus culcitae TaxID=2969821 RepID=A0ABY5P4J8_9LACT|nr:CpsB/CapC family capsule biosynthesis tyrosine phosphatase [Fundicoccus culcitae]UUX33671.1 hypothetical protein NRE15_12295 [Fundicoccus culcitae]